jgi:hypothetical protein
MGVSETITQVVHAATTAPRLCSAALKAGVGPAGAVQVLRISEGALRTSAARGSGVPGRTNALRHFMWQALLTARFDRSVAASIARSQERGTPNEHDSRVDHHNNAAGQAYGEANPGLASGPLSDALESLADVGLEKWESDELIWVKEH